MEPTFLRDGLKVSARAELVKLTPLEKLRDKPQLQTALSMSILLATISLTVREVGGALSEGWLS